MDKAIFFDAVRRQPFAGLAASQVAGMEADLDEALRRGTALDRLSYMLATEFRETGGTMQPIYERGARAYFNKYEPGTRLGKMLGNSQPGDGFRYRGTGKVQITGRANFEKAGRKLGIDLVGHPELALDLGHATQIMFSGMEEGWFTGRKLSDMLDGVDESDAEDWREFYKSRPIINSMDHAGEIANEAIAFEHALRAAGYGR